MYRNNECTPDAEHLTQLWSVIITITNKKTIADNIVKIDVLFYSVYMYMYVWYNIYYKNT